jgi:hypothetical protein
VSYLPPEYLAYKDLLATNPEHAKTGVDSLATLYGPTFLFVIKPTKNENLLYRGIQGYKEFAVRKNILHFKMDRLISLKTGGKEYKPVLTNAEVLDEITREIKIWASFSSDPFLKNGEISFPGKKLDVVLEDPFWDTGVNHFVFKRDDIMRLPDVIIKTQKKIASKPQKHKNILIATKTPKPQNTLTGLKIATNERKMEETTISHQTPEKSLYPVRVELAIATKTQKHKKDIKNRIRVGKYFRALEFSWLNRPQGIQSFRAFVFSWLFHRPQGTPHDIHP